MPTGVAIILFALGVLLVLLEVFVPSFGLLTLGAVVCFGLSIWGVYDPERPAAAWAMGIGAPILSILILYFGLRIVPRTSWGRGLVLRHPSDDGEVSTPTASEATALPPEGGTIEEQARPLVGKTGIAQSDLRPAGVALIDQQRVDVVTEGPMLDAGTRVRVVTVEGNRIVVRRVTV